jgi:hypothetical protein
LAKFSRLGPVWRKPKPKPWKQLKNCARWANERQYASEFDPEFTLDTEILTGEGWGILLESADPALPIFIGIE